MKLHITAKCSDCCTTSVPELSLEKQGYVPRELGVGGGDYIRLVIDTNTGEIDGWIPLTPLDLREALKTPKKKT
jgi:hypothetical protein